MKQKAITNMDRPPVTQPSPAFVLIWGFKLEPEYHVISDDEQEVDEQDLVLAFKYKHDHTKQIDWDAVPAQPRNRVENSSANKTAVVNL